MNDSKHIGETIAGVTMQMRFIPLKVDPQKEKKIIPWNTGDELFATIKTHIDDTKKSTPDNLREFTIPTISRLTFEGETFIKNKLKLINTIFIPKGWTSSDSITNGLEKYVMFMTNTVNMDFVICQQKV